MICNGQETVFHFLKVGDFEEWGAVIYNFKMFLVAIFFKRMSLFCWLAHCF